MDMDQKQLQRVLTEAFRRSQKSRERKGLPVPDAEIKRTRGGGRWVGPKSYRITLWLRPWQYLALCEDQRKSHHRGSLTSYLQGLFTPGVVQRRNRKAA